LDSTNVTKAACHDITEKIPTILDLHDSVHHIQLTIKDITAIEEFKSVCCLQNKRRKCADIEFGTCQFIQLLKGILKYFGKSSYGSAKLCDARNIAGSDEPVNGLQKIGKTCFRTYWLACTSLDPYLPALWGLVTDKVIKSKVGD